MRDQVFPFRFAPAYRIAGLLFGVTPARSRVLVDADRLLARLGPWQVVVELSNIADTEITGPYRFVKTAGPAHLSFSDHGLTMATNGQRGLCLALRAPVPGIEPIGHVRHPHLTLTVEDCGGLLAALRSPES